MGNKKHHGRPMWDTIPPWDNRHNMISLDPHTMMASVHPSTLHPSMFANRTDFEMAMRSMQSHRRGKHPIESFHNGPYVVSCDKMTGCHTAVELEGNDRAHALLDAQRLGWFIQDKTCLCPDCFQAGAKRLLRMIFEEEETCH